MHWRGATAGDARSLAELNHQLIADEGHRNEMTLEELERRMLGWLESEYRAVLFYDDAEPVAYALYRHDDSGRIHLRQFFVARHRRRKGVGRAALELFRTAVIAPGQRIVLEVLTGNDAGRAFWLAMGFREYALTLELEPDAGS